ncbi:MAG: hypothetical protein IJ323_00110 [Clostridia bacterium]|nr:hypothetical protein [Clostridia bacterium]
MSTVIYNHYYKELDCDIAHINDKGIIFNHPVHEAGYSCGHVGDGGRVYSHPTSKAGYCIGHVDENGKIYDHPTSKTGHCVGHVDENGVIYNHSNSELGFEVGHASGPYYREAAVYYLLGMDNKKGIDLSKVAKVAKTVGSAVGGGGGGGSSQSTAENVQGSSSSQSTAKNVSSPSVNTDASTNFSIYVLIFIIAIVVGLVNTIKYTALNFPGFILMFVYVVKAFLTPAVRADIHKFNVSDADRQRAKDDAKASLVMHSILPIILGIYAFIKQSSTGGYALILAVAPVISILVIAYLCNYKKSLYEAHKLNSQKPAVKKSTDSNNTAPKKEAIPKEKKAEPKKAPVTETKKESVIETKNAETPEKIIVECENCHTKMRISAGKGKVKVRCPKCQTENIVNT